MDNINNQDLDAVALANFVNYLKFPTVHPNPNYWPAVEWLIKQGRELGLTPHLVHIIPDNPIVLLCWYGSMPELPTILLNSHIDVVPVDESKWTRPPFGAEIDSDGYIYARGSQDMKCVGIQQLEAVRRLKARGYTTPKRTVWLSFVPDEELGGLCGMLPFVKGEQPPLPASAAPTPATVAMATGAPPVAYADMRVGLCLDEGLASPSGNYVAFYEERSPWWLTASCSGATGHGSAFIANTAAAKLQAFVNRMLAFREEERCRLEASRGDLLLGDVTTVNLTRLSGGLQVNIVPSVLEATFDIRMAPTCDFIAFEKQLHDWAADADRVGGGSGDGVKLSFENQDMGTTGRGCLSATRPDLKTDVWWSRLEAVCRRMRGVSVTPCIFQGATDARYVRRAHRINKDIAAKGQPPAKSINFSPMINTKVLLHDHDECLHRDEFLSGCAVYTELLYLFAENEQD